MAEERDGTPRGRDPKVGAVGESFAQESGTEMQEYQIGGRGRRYATSGRCNDDQDGVGEKTNFISMT